MRGRRRRRTAGARWRRQPTVKLRARGKEIGEIIGGYRYMYMYIYNNIYILIYNIIYIYIYIYIHTYLQYFQDKRDNNNALNSTFSLKKTMK